MKIDFDEITLAVEPNFKGGEKSVAHRAYADKINRILELYLEPGASVGEHTHTDSSEIMFITSGAGKVIIDGAEERLTAGDIHYCPKGSTHTLINDGTDTLHLYAVIPQQ